MNYVKRIREKIGNDPLILVGSNVIVLNENDEILLQKRNNNSWGLLGGLLEIGESLEETAIREIQEEANIKIKNLKLLNVFSGKEYFFKLQNNDQIYVITALYVAEYENGILCPDGIETIDLQYFKLDSLPNNMDEEYKTYINYYLSLKKLK